MEGKACILKDFFFDMNPIALRKAKSVYNFDFLSAIGFRKIVLSKDIKIIFLHYFLFCFNCQK